jgi:oxaloacetate decarboxylase alpha subunit
VLGDEKPSTGRYADNLEPAFEKTKVKLGALAHSDEDVLTYIAYPQLAEKFFEQRDNPKAVLQSTPTVKSAAVKYSVRRVD